MCFIVHIEYPCEKQHSRPGIALGPEKKVFDRIDGLFNYLERKLGQTWRLGNPYRGKSYLETLG